MKTNRWVGLTIASWVTLTSPTDARSQASVEAVAQHLIGVMDTSAQAERIDDMPNVRMTTCNVTVESRTERFLYQEQALNRTLDRPYRQRFLSLTLTDEGQSVESKAYEPTTLEPWIGLCQKPERDRLISPTQINAVECSVFLAPWHNVYIGHTQSGGCPADFRGATTITNIVVLHGAGMDTWDRGFNAQGQQIWGARDRPYQFRWLNESGALEFPNAP
jgi:hypothetical protein